MLTISNLSKTYGNGVRALRNINLTIDSGMFGLLGPNGAGKSTLMRTIATLQPADSGSIVFNGYDAFKSPQIYRNQLGYLPQEFGVYPRISAYDLLDHFGILKGLTDSKMRKDQINALLHQTNLFRYRKKSVHNFSGGMKKRFGIAQALLGDPRLIIVDEPTAGLDPEERNRFHNFLSEIGENIIVLLSTHIVADVSNLCPNMAILADGEIRLSGEPARLIGNIRGRVWQKTISKGDLQKYRERFTVISSHLTTGKLRIHVLSDHRPEKDFEPREPSLEDVYFTSLLNHRLVN
ncbi:MAG: ABC transporter ATP-binding protein [Calditrichaceae bacterium]